MPPIDPASFGAIGESMKAFAVSAASGEFAINPDTGGDALLKAIRDMKDWVDERRAHLNLLTNQPPLGTSHGANTMKPYVAEVATDSQGFIPMLLKFRESLDDAEKGISDAIDNYRELDQRGVTRQQVT